VYNYIDNKTPVSKIYCNSNIISFHKTIMCQKDT